LGRRDDLIAVLRISLKELGATCKLKNDVMEHYAWLLGHVVPAFFRDFVEG